jgi:hypothetical protein
MVKMPLPVSIAWQPFPNEKQPSGEDPSRQNLRANCADALKSFPVGDIYFDALILNREFGFSVHTSQARVTACMSPAHNVHLNFRRIQGRVELTP